MKRFLITPLIAALLWPGDASATVYNLCQNVTTTTTVPQYIAPAPPQTVAPPEQSLQVNVTGTGAVSASVQVLASNDGQNWINYGSVITVAGTTSAGQFVTGGGTGNTTYAQFAAIITAISGTNAAVTVTLSE